MNETTMSILTLAVLVFVIAFGFLKKFNIGILSFGVALLLGRFIGMTDKEIVGGFNTGLFVILLGAMLLFGIAHLNGTIELLAKKLVALFGRQGWMLPFAMYIVGFLVAFLGPGTIPSFGVVALFGVPLAAAIHADPFLICCIGQLGGIAGGIVPWAPTGVIGIEKAAEAGFTDHIATPLFINVTIGTLFIALCIFVLYKGWRLHGDTHVNFRDLPKFNQKQWLTLVGILAMVATVVIFKTNIGLTSFLISIVLILLGCGDLSKAISSISYNTLFMVIGTGVLMNVVITGGGINLLAHLLSEIMSVRTAPALISLAAGIMSWFSSTSGVVMPTLIPTIPAIFANLGTDAIPPAMMVSAITLGSSVAGLSPASTGGGLIYAALAGEKEYENEDMNKLFLKLFLTSVFSVAMAFLFALIGGYQFTPYN